MNANKKPRVLIVMSTYNGERYLREQLNSLLSQKDVEINIRVADDCSTDNTVSILEEYKKKYPNIDFYINKTNKGFTYNFLDLFFSVKNESFDYLAFSDQDDVWLDNKLISAIKMIKDNDKGKGMLYCSNLKNVDRNLNYLSMQEKKDISKSKRYSYLVANIATGCTIVIDRKLYDISIKYYPKDIYLHDYWIFLIGAYLGNFVYDTNAYILYRQHGNNQIGSNKKFFTKNKISNFLKPKHSTTRLLDEFIKGYKDDIDPLDFKYISLAAYYKNSFKNRMKLFFSAKINRRSFKLLFKVKVLLGKY